MQFPQSGKIHSSARRSSLFFAALSLTALAATFTVSNLNLTFPVKLAIFAAIVAFYLAVGAAANRRQTRRIEIETTGDKPESVFNEAVEAKLFALEEAHQFFGASLKFADMFRLVASRLNEITPFATGLLLVADEEKTTLTMQFAVGENMREFNGLKIRTGSGLAGKTLFSGEAQIDERLAEEAKAITAKTLKNLQTGIAVPLRRGAEIFGVLVLYGDAKRTLNRNSLELLEAAATRVAPLFLSSQTYENNLANALTDALTSLPNERAFYLVLENQIAEAQRFRGERTLTVLTIDIADFEEINQRFGHATGDRILGFAADMIKSQLRQMDFLARSVGDEFLAVLPTATEAVTREVIERVRKTFVLHQYRISASETVSLQLNFGASSFWKDGETATALVRHALLKKQQSKNKDGENKILFFPQEFVN